MDELFEQHRKWFEGFYQVDIQGMKMGTFIPPQPNTRYTCPCFGYPTLLSRGGFEICELCWCEDDGQDDLDANIVWGGPNDWYSLADARINFKRYYTMYDPQDIVYRNWISSNSTIEIQARRSIAATFEPMVGETDQSRLTLFGSAYSIPKRYLRKRNCEGNENA